MIDAPNEAINAKSNTNQFLVLQLRGLKQKKVQCNVVINKNLIKFLIFSLVIKIEITKTIIGYVQKIIIVRLTLIYVTDINSPVVSITEANVIKKK